MTISLFLFVCFSQCGRMQYRHYTTTKDYILTYPKNNDIDPSWDILDKIYSRHQITANTYVGVRL